MSEAQQELFDRARRDFHESDLAKKLYPCPSCCGTAFSIVYPCMEEGYSPFPRYEGEKKIDSIVTCLNASCGKRFFVFVSEIQTIEGTLRPSPPEPE